MYDSFGVDRCMFCFPRTPGGVRHLGAFNTVTPKGGSVSIRECD